MKNIAAILSLVMIVFVSCDGRQSKKESLENSIAEFNKTSENIVLNVYYPESYVEIQNDTLVDNSLNVQVKNYALMHENVLISKIDDEVLDPIKYHRVFESEITIHSSNKLIYNTTINANTFITNQTDEFWHNATLEHVWLNEIGSTSEHANFHISFINPQTNNFKLYQMNIHISGERTLNLIEES